jgi:hypothetical protein
MGFKISSVEFSREPNICGYFLTVSSTTPTIENENHAVDKECTLW